jgi:hypothetical protein
MTEADAPVAEEHPEPSAAVGKRKAEDNAEDVSDLKKPKPDDAVPPGAADTWRFLNVLDATACLDGKPPKWFSLAGDAEGERVEEVAGADAGIEQVLVLVRCHSSSLTTPKETRGYPQAPRGARSSLLFWGPFVQAANPLAAFQARAQPRTKAASRLQNKGPEALRGRVRSPAR